MMVMTGLLELGTRVWMRRSGTHSGADAVPMLPGVADDDVRDHLLNGQLVAAEDPGDLVELLIAETAERLGDRRPVLAQADEHIRLADSGVVPRLLHVVLMHLGHRTLRREGLPGRQRPEHPRERLVRRRDVVGDYADRPALILAP